MVTMDTTGEWSVASQGRAFCQHYIIQRSLKAGAQMKKIKSLFYTGVGCQVSDLLAERLLEIVQTMERLNPNIYNSCSAKLKLTMSTDDQVRWTYENITTELIKTGVNWGKVISIFTVCGALAADCVSQGHTDFLPIILDCFEETCAQPVVRNYLKEINGWRGVVEHYDRRVPGMEIVDSNNNPGVGDFVEKSRNIFYSLPKYMDKLFISAVTLFVVMFITLTKVLLKEHKT